LEGFILEIKIPNIHPKFWVGTFCWDDFEVFLVHFTGRIFKVKLRIGTFFNRDDDPFLIGPKKYSSIFTEVHVFLPVKGGVILWIWNVIFPKGGANFLHHVESM